ncbi:MAG: hypothetical protein QXI93_00335 [Candidatus Methanomethylicia archaeon]
MEDVVEYVFVAFMFFLLISSSTIFIGFLAKNYIIRSKPDIELIFDTITSILAPENCLDPILMQSLCKNYSLTFGYYLGYDEFRDLINFEDFSFSILITPPLHVDISFKDGFIIINSFNVFNDVPCGDIAYIHIFHNNNFNQSFHIHLDSGVGGLFLGFKPELAVVFVEYGPLFGVGVFGDYRVSYGSFLNGFIFLSSLERNLGYSLMDGVIGGSIYTNITDEGLIFYTREFSHDFNIFHGYLNVSTFFRGFGSIRVDFGVCSKDYDNFTIIISDYFSISSINIERYDLRIPIHSNFHGSNLRMFLKFTRIDGEIYIYFGGWSAQSNFTLNCDIPLFSKNILIPTPLSHNLWSLWFDHFKNLNDYYEIQMPCILVYTFNSTYHIMFLPYLNISIGFMIGKGEYFRFLTFDKHVILCIMSTYSNTLGFNCKLIENFLPLLMEIYKAVNIGWIAHE